MKLSPIKSLIDADFLTEAQKTRIGEFLIDNRHFEQIYGKADSYKEAKQIPAMLLSIDEQTEKADGND